jgi:hypothetical protein
MPYRVPTSGIPLLQDPPFVCALVLLGTALGARLLRALRAPREELSALEQGVLAAALGLGLLQYLPFALGMAHRLTPTALGWGLAALALLLAGDMRRVVKGVRQALRRRLRVLPPRWILAGALLLAFPLASALLQALSPPIDGDGLGYHLAAPKRWLQSGDLRYLPTLMHTNAPMGVEMLFTDALALRSDTAAKLIHFALGLLACAAVFALGRRLSGESVGFAAAALWLYGLPRVSALTYFGIAFVDMGLVFETLTAVLAYLLWRQTRNRAWLVVAALCAGFAASFKLTGLWIGLILGALLVVRSRREGVPLRAAAAQGAAFAALALLPVLPWLWRTLRVTGDPVYPLLTSVFPARDWSRDAEQVYTAYFRYYNLWGPPEWDLAMRQRIWAGALLLTAAVTVASFLRWRDGNARFLMVLTGALLWLGLATTGLTFRLLAPVYPLLALLLCLRLAAPLTQRRGTQAAVLAVLALNGAYALPGTLKELPWTSGAAVGRISRRDYLAHTLRISRVWEALNRLPAEGAALAPGSGPLRFAHSPASRRAEGPVLVAALQPADSTTGGLAFYCDRDCYVTDAYLQQYIRMDTWPHYLGDLRRRHIVTVVAPFAIRPGYVRIGPDYAPARHEFPFARHLVETYGRLLYKTGNYGLYRLQGIEKDDGETLKAENRPFFALDRQTY